MRVLVCGGRDYRDGAAVRAVLDAVFDRCRFPDRFLIIQGGADGADMLARDWCVKRSIPFANYPADWKRLGPSAGPIRNQRMIDDGRPSLVVAFPGGRGTADMTRRAKAAGIEVLEYCHEITASETISKQTADTIEAAEKRSFPTILSVIGSDVE